MHEKISRPTEMDSFLFLFPLGKKYMLHRRQAKPTIVRVSLAESK